jgi:hypothetical protein
MPTIMTAVPAPTIDRRKLRARLRRLGDEYLYYLLQDALDALSDADLGLILARYIRIEELAPDPASVPIAAPSVLAEVRSFDTAARAGAYYESFMVDSRNCMAVSRGTRAFISECHRLLDLCIATVDDAEAQDTCAAFETIFDLLRHVDECLDDVVFFADEGGSWQVGVIWSEVFPAWFRVLSMVADPATFARKAVATIDHFEAHDRERYLAVAEHIASAPQRVALRAALRTTRGRRQR